MKKELPARASLEHLKSQAKDLLDAFRRGEAAARQRFRESLPAMKGATEARLESWTPALHDAQSVIAREYGFASFAELKAAVERSATTPGYLRELIRRNLKTPLPAAVLQAVQEARARPLPDLSTLPSEIPIIPLRNAVLTVGATAPLMIARPESVRAIEAAKSGLGWLGVFAQKDEEKEAPELSDLHAVGCRAQLMTSIPQRVGLWAVVRAVEAVTLDAISRREPLLLGRVSRFEITSEAASEIQPLEHALRERARALAGSLPEPEQLLSLLDGLNARELADAVVVNLPATVEAKARYASEKSLARRLQLALSLAGGD